LSKLVPVDWRTFVKRLQELRFEGPYSGGKHPFMRKGDLVLTIPNPHKGAIGIDLLARILK
jgi:predicted RNA binding protein YcfA (HicA-like mRNA interferase family)